MQGRAPRQGKTGRLGNATQAPRQGKAFRLGRAPSQGSAMHSTAPRQARAKQGAYAGREMQGWALRQCGALLQGTAMLGKAGRLGKVMQAD
jgi:hypothetical protein